MIQRTTEWYLSIYELFKTTFVSVVEKLRSGSKTNNKVGFSSVFSSTLLHRNILGSDISKMEGLETPTHVSHTKTQQNNKQLQTEENSPRIALGYDAEAKTPWHSMIHWGQWCRKVHHFLRSIPQPRAAWHQEGCPGRKFTTWGKRKTRAGLPNSWGGAHAAPAAMVSYHLHQRCSGISSQKVYPQVPCPIFRCSPKTATQINGTNRVQT